MYPYQEDSISTLMAIVVLIVPTLAFVSIAVWNFSATDNFKKIAISIQFLDLVIRPAVGKIDTYCPHLILDIRHGSDAAKK